MSAARSIWRYGWLVVLLALAISLCWDMGRTWTAYHDYNGAVWSQSAHNNLRAGLSTTLGVPTGFYFGPLPIPADGYYAHHPPLLPLAVTGMFALFGEHEWAARLVPITASLLAVVLLWLLLRGCVGERAATLGAVVMASQPMLLYLGQMVNFEPLVLPLALGTLLALRAHRYGWALVCVGIGLWLCWHVHLFVIVLTIWFCRRNQPQERRFVLASCGLAIASIVAFVVVTHLVRHDAWRSAWEAVTRRVMDRGETGHTWTQWFGAQWMFFTTRFVPITWLLVLVGAILARRHEIGRPAALLTCTAFVVVAGLPNFSYIHDYAGYYFLATVGILGGVALEALWKRRLGPVFVAVILFVLAGWGITRSQWLRQMPFHITRWGEKEPRDLIPQLGMEIKRSYPETARVQLNFLPVYGPHLAYYAQRQLYNNLMIFKTGPGWGGVVWLDATDAAATLAALPTGNRREVIVGGYRFSFWIPESVGKDQRTVER